MATASPPPDDATLRAFLLGTLPPDRVEAVSHWLEADPSHAGRLEGLKVSDSLTDAVSQSTLELANPTASIERILRGLSDSLHGGLPADGAGEHGGTIPQLFPPADTAAVAVWPPTRLGGYRIVRELGHGGMGYVFEAEDEKLARRVAVKVLTPDLARRPDATARFLREARAAAAVEHENVVPILHVGEDAGVPYMVMPLLKGESLADRLKRSGKLSVAEVIRVGNDVAAGLLAAHSKGLVHRDMKPANVWLDGDSGRARVLDFGLARLGDGADALTEAGALMGTPAYMAPEQIDGFPATSRSDLFSLGAMLYECVTGQRAFTGPTITAVLKSVGTHQPPAPAEVDSAVPAALSALIMRLLAKTPDDRHTDAREVLASLSAIPIADRSPTVSFRDLHPSQGPKRKRYVWLVAGAVAAVVLVAAGVAISLPKDSRPTADIEPQPKPQSPPTRPSSGTVEPPPPTRAHGKIDVHVERTTNGMARLLRLNEPGALPLRKTDKFRIEGEVDPPMYLYVLWVDPDHDVTPVYPWDPKVGWGSRPAMETASAKVSLPANVGNRYTAPAAKAGVATMVLFARTTPLDVPDDVVKKWFEALPELPLPPNGDGAAVWFDNYTEVRDPQRLRTFGEVGSDDAFSLWQGQLQKSLGGKATFQTAVSFARTGRK